MSAVDFAAWLEPLVLKLGDRTYTVPIPTTADAKLLIASAVAGEVNLGLAKGPIPDEVEALLETVQPGDHPALTREVWQQMLDDGIPHDARNRMSYYAVFYWARGKEYADLLALALWGPEVAAAAEAVAAPKAPPTSPPPSGWSTGSANP